MESSLSFIVYEIKFNVTELMFCVIIVEFRLKQNSYAKQSSSSNDECNSVLSATVGAVLLGNFGHVTENLR